MKVIVLLTGFRRQINYIFDQTDDGDTESDKKEETPPPYKRNVVAHNTFHNRNVPHDGNTLIESVPFSNLGKIQPFLVSISTSSLLLLDFHCHLTKTEVCGYLGGSWDVNGHSKNSEIFIHYSKMFMFFLLYFQP